MTGGEGRSWEACRPWPSQVGFTYDSYTYSSQSQQIGQIGFNPEGFLYGLIFVAKLETNTDL